MDPYASGRAALSDLAATYSDDTDLNEATTRLRFIDTILMDSLAWPAASIESEKHYRGEYVDYALGHPAVEMILEAKREGVSFSLPAGLAGRRSVQLSTLIEDQPTRAAVEQVLHYCQNRGVPLAAISNGHQLVALFASRQDGIPPLDGQALVFSSLQEMVDDFRVLWQHLSRPGVAQKNLQRTLLSPARRPLPPLKLSEQIDRYPGFRPRTTLETDLKILGGLLIQDLEQEASVSEEFLRQCYCSSGALSQYAMVSKEILRARYSQVAISTNIEAQPARTRKGPNPSLTADVVAAALSRRPLIILGDVGVGKSMFLRHFLQIDAADVLSDSFTFYVDFGRQPALSTNLEPFVVDKLADQLLGKYDIDIDEASFVRAVYNGELNRLRRGIYKALLDEDPSAYRVKELERLEELTKNRAGHVRRSLEHLRATRGRQTVVVLDNIDQRPQDFQERVFLIAEGLADSWPAAVFVSLRPSTFYESRSRGTLAAYQMRVFTVSPTRTDDVISRRLSFAKGQLEKPGSDGAFPNLSLSNKDLSAYLDVLIQAFTVNDELKQLVDNLSGGNLRVALTFLSTFVGSGYVSTQRILDAAAAGDTYTVPIHEFLRAVIFGDYDYFDPQASEVCNIFDISTADGREHFLLPTILAFTQRSGETAGGDGYVPISEIYAFGQTIGFNAEQVAPHISRAVAKRLMEAPPGRAEEGPYRITSVGSYMYKSMAKRFVYVSAVIVDTPVTDAQVRGQIRDARTIVERLDRAVIFVDYLDEMWSQFSAGGNDLEGFDWPVTSAQLRADIADVRGRAERAVAKRRSL